MTPTRYESCIRDLHAMMHFILRLQSTQNRDCALDGWFIYGNWLESPFERRVFSDGFAVLVGCDTSGLKTREDQNWSTISGRKTSIGRIRY